MKLLKVKKMDKRHVILILCPAGGDTNDIESAICQGNAFRMIPSDKTEAEEWCTEKTAGKVVALWNAGWDLKAISNDVRISDMEAARVISAYQEYPDLDAFHYKEDSCQETDE